MGYACPVCETPQADGRHLANHLAFTAMIHGDDHEAWLAEHAPGWDEAGERELAPRVIESARKIEFPPGAEDATEREGTADTHDHGGHDHDHGHGGHTHGDGQGRNRANGQVQSRGPADVAIDTGVGGGDERDVAAVVREARELTRRMRDEDGRNEGDEHEGGGEHEEGSDERSG